MQVFSRTHTIVDNASARVVKTGPDLPDSAIISNPPYTLLELKDEDAERLISDGIAERYVRAVHGESPPYKQSEPIDPKPSVVSRLT